MSLFDVIKYGNINLADAAQLIGLPRPIFNLYRANAYRHYGTDMPELRLSESVEGMLEWVDEGNMSIAREIFLRTLRSYDELV